MKVFFFLISLRKSSQNLYGRSNTKTINVSVKKKALVRLSHSAMYLDLSSGIRIRLTLLNPAVVGVTIARG